MKAEDTVKWCDDNVYCQPYCHETQAEITWTIAFGLGRTEGSYVGEEEGRKAGIREVVEAIERYGVMYKGNPWWDKKLKEWGIE